MRQIIFFIPILISFQIFSQSLPIFLDGRFDDWTLPVPTYIDTENDGNNLDFKYFSVTNDETFLYFKLKATPFFKLVEDNQILLYIDGDNNSGTGFQINGIGAELRLNLGQRNGYNYYTNSTFTHSTIQFRSLPGVTDTTHEFAIGLQYIPPSGGNGTIKILFIDNSTGGDRMPNIGETFTYTFDITPVEPFTPIDISRTDTSLLRIMNWNVYNDGLLNQARQPSYQRILQALNPDIIAFNELFQSSAFQVRNAMNQLLPLPSGGQWHAVKLDAGNVTVSKYPITQSWLVYPPQRITASLIDLPEKFGKDILIINSHYKCCGGAANDEVRQREADATIAFLLDAKTPGGSITLPDMTPFIVLGDLNLVGDRQQLITLLTGEIINTQLFGNGATPDWDNTNLDDILSSHSDKRTAYTWRNDQSTFPPGRLDFQIYSNSIINIENNFVLQTEVMTPERLNVYGLQLSDTRTASDHFPKVSDISFKLSTGNDDLYELKDFYLYQNYPNPFNPVTKIKFTIPNVIASETKQSQFVSLKVYDVLGNEIDVLVNEEKQPGVYEVEFDASSLTSGVYFYKIQNGSFFEVKKMILLK